MRPLVCARTMGRDSGEGAGVPYQLSRRWGRSTVRGERTGRRGRGGGVARGALGCLGCAAGVMFVLCGLALVGLLIIATVGFNSYGSNK